MGHTLKVDKPRGNGHRRLRAGLATRQIVWHGLEQHALDQATFGRLDAAVLRLDGIDPYAGDQRPQQAEQTHRAQQPCRGVLDPVRRASRQPPDPGRPFPPAVLFTAHGRPGPSPPGSRPDVPAPR